MVFFYVDIYVNGKKFEMMNTNNAEFANAIKILLIQLKNIGVLKVDKIDVHI